MRSALGRITPHIHAVSASPYGARAEVARAAESLQQKAPDLVVLHCMGFRREHHRLVRRMTGRPVIAAASLVARTLAEMLAVA